MSMYIFAKKGDKVRFAHPEAGYLEDRKRTAELLTVGEIYTIEYTEVGQSSTSVTFQELPGVRFNSVFFEDIS